MVTGPTHEHHDGSRSTIDLVFMSEPSLLNQCDTVPPLSNSDHCGVLMDLSKKQAIAEKSQGRLIWRYAYADWAKACELIEDFNWDSILSGDIELSWKLWYHQFMSAMSQSIPNTRIRTRRNLPWLNKPIVKLMRKRNQLFKRAKRSGNFHQYRLARNRTLTQLRKAKKKYFRKLNPKDPKKFWKAIKYLNKNKSSIPTLSLEDKIAHSDADKANLLNSFFTDCFNNSHPPIQLQEVSRHPSCPEEILCSESEVGDLLAALDPSKASGKDDISAKMLKYTAYSIAPSITKLFNLSLTTGTIPSVWKKSLIVPIPKNQELSNPSNYRPVSLLPIVSKVLERHIFMIVMDHLKLNHPLSAFQWGFLEGRSTVTALLHLTDQWFQALESGHDVCAVFFDFRKAFDSVPHFPLMAKIRSLGLPESITRWLNNYLADRFQMVVVNGSVSSEAAVLSGVPQGSVLGPLLFLIYIDDLPNVVQALLGDSKVNLFADDILLYHLILNPDDYILLQRAVLLVEQWSVANFLSFNAGKCKYMTVSRKQSPLVPSNPLKLFGTPLQKVDCYKYLGLLLTTNLSWSAHITSICSKAKKILGLIYRRFYGSADQTTLKQLYLSLVRPHLEYACQIWDPHLVKDQKMLENVEKFGCRLAAHHWDASYQELLELFELQPLEQRRLYLKLGMMFKIIHKLCYFPNAPPIRDDLPSLRGVHSLPLDPPFAHTNAYKYSFFPHTMSAWNSLTNECVTSSSYSSFMRQLRLSYT